MTSSARSCRTASNWIHQSPELKANCSGSWNVDRKSLGEFILDEISFATNNKTLKSSSRKQLKNIAKILKAYPNTEIVINGYTDNLGEKAHNLKLSRERASYVLQELARIGVDKSRMTAKGFGDDHPVASNNSEEGRTRNRRISIYVTRK